jgi:hypothetical protein
MLGRPATDSISAEVKAEHSALAIAEALELEPSEQREDAIYRNAKHLQIVIDTLDISQAKRVEYQNLITTYLID